MTIAEWIAHALLALAFMLGGLMKATRPIAQLKPIMPWTDTVPVGVVRFNGLAELLGGVGLAVPALTGIQPWLTPAAAAGLVLIPLLAMGFHSRRREFPALPVNLVLTAVLAFVAYGRIALLPV